MKDIKIERTNPERAFSLRTKTVEKLEVEMLNKFADMYTSINTKYTEALREINTLKKEIENIKSKYPVDPIEPDKTNDTTLTLEEVCKGINKIGEEILTSTPISDGQIERVESNIKSYLESVGIVIYELSVRRDYFCDDIVNIEFSYDDNNDEVNILAEGGTDDKNTN